MGAKTGYKFLQEVILSEKCYLFEVLSWRAFGRIPEASYTDDGKEWRFSEDVRDSYEAPNPRPEFLSVEECRFAGINTDPRNEEEDYYFSDLSHYDKMIELILKSGDHAELAKYKEERRQAEVFNAAVAEWMLEYNDYVDQFASEIFLSLRKGDLRAVGTACAVGGEEHAFDKCGDDDWPTLSDEHGIPKECWVSGAINWSDSALEGREKAFMWVHVETGKIINLFPPVTTVPAKSLLSSGDTFYIAENAPVHKGLGVSRGGRPALPWGDFHVEVARMFRDGDVPKKQEAAIAELQDWFFRTHGKKASRAVILSKLKPYYDRLVRAGQKPK